MPLIMRIGIARYISPASTIPIIKTGNNITPNRNFVIPQVIFTAVPITPPMNEIINMIKSNVNITATSQVLLIFVLVIAIILLASFS